MSEVVFRYQRLLPVAFGGDDQVLFAQCYPAEAHWLRDNAGAFRVSAYWWPEFIARLVCDRLGMTVCEFELWLEQQIAERFGQAFGMRGSSDA